MTKKVTDDRELKAFQRKHQQMRVDEELREMAILADREALLSRERERAGADGVQGEAALESEMKAIRKARRKKGTGQWGGLPVSSFSKTVVPHGDVVVLQQVYPADIVAERFYSNGVYERFYRDGTFHQIDPDGKTVRYGIGSYLTL